MHVEDELKMIICLIELFLMSAAAFFDIRKKEISLWLLVAMTIVEMGGTAYGLYTGKSSCVEIAVSLIPGIIMLFISWITKQGMGYGDGLLVLAVSTAFGFYKIAIGLSVAFFMTGIISVYLIVIRKAKRRDSVPFIPFILLGMVVSMFA